MIKNRFESLHKQAIAGELSSWRKSAEGSLAEIIVLDQFSRNIYRDTVDSFTSDSLALVLAQNMVASGQDMSLSPLQRSFVYLPFMHSESKLIHKQAVQLYEKLGQKENLEFELKHKAIIDQFERYPHRNKILKRVSTNEEIDFLKGPNSSF